MLSRMVGHAQCAVPAIVPAEGPAGAGGSARRQRAVQAARLHWEPVASLPGAAAVASSAAWAQGMKNKHYLKNNASVIDWLRLRGAGSNPSQYPCVFKIRICMHVYSTILWWRYSYQGKHCEETLRRKSKGAWSRSIRTWPKWFSRLIALIRLSSSTLLKKMKYLFSKWAAIFI